MHTNNYVTMPLVQYIEEEPPNSPGKVGMASHVGDIIVLLIKHK